MNSSINSKLANGFPRLGWIAMAEPPFTSVNVLHGDAVEWGNSYVVEGIWSDTFAHGNFHRDPNFFGSGVRVDKDELYFVPSSASVDRLFFYRYSDRLYVSNSLIILLAISGARLDVTHDYRIQANAILGGVEDYSRVFPVIHPEITSFYQVFCENIIVKDGQISFERRKSTIGFAGFDGYLHALKHLLAQIRENYESNTRSIPIEAFSTLSTGYDSTAVSTLVKDIGVTRCFSYTGSWSGGSAGSEEFDASPIASTLGLSPISLDSRVDGDEHDELHLYAASPAGAQLPLLDMGRYIKKHSRLAVVFTGYHGDCVWDVHASDRIIGSHCARKDVSGLDLSQLRLECGFINLPVPFLYADRIRDIVGISRQEEMHPWRMFNAYDRPIPRRIVEESGVKRSQFGQIKSAIYTRRNRPRGRKLKDQYLRNLRDELGIPVPLIYACLAVDRLAFRFLTFVMQFLPEKGRWEPIRSKLACRRERLGQGDSVVYKGMNLRLSLYRWSVHVLTRQLAQSGHALSGLDAASTVTSVDGAAEEFRTSTPL